MGIDRNVHNQQRTRRAFQRLPKSLGAGLSSNSASGQIDANIAVEWVDTFEGGSQSADTLTQEVRVEEPGDGDFPAKLTAVLVRIAARVVSRSGQITLQLALRAAGSEAIAQIDDYPPGASLSERAAAAAQGELDAADAIVIDTDGAIVFDTDGEVLVQPGDLSLEALSALAAFLRIIADDDGTALVDDEGNIVVDDDAGDDDAACIDRILTDTDGVPIVNDDGAIILMEA